MAQAKTTASDPDGTADCHECELLCPPERVKECKDCGFRVCQVCIDNAEDPGWGVYRFSFTGTDGRFLCPECATWGTEMSKKRHADYLAKRAKFNKPWVVIMESWTRRNFMKSFLITEGGLSLAQLHAEDRKELEGRLEAIRKEIPVEDYSPVYDQLTQRVRRIDECMIVALVARERIKD